jgi:hypothetical protein
MTPDRLTLAGYHHLPLKFLMHKFSVIFYVETFAVLP